MDNLKNAPAPVSRLLAQGDLNARARSPTALTVARKMRDNLPTLTIAKKAILFFFNVQTIGRGNCTVLVTVHRIDTFTNKRNTLIPFAYRVIRRRHKTSLPWPPLMKTMQRSIQMDSGGCNKYKKEIN